MRTRRKTLIALSATVFSPPLLWCLVVAALPTGPVRRAIECGLSRSTGQTAHIGEVRLRLGGGLSLRDVSLTCASHPELPWLEIDRLSIDPDLGLLLRLRYEPKTARIEGALVRIRRSADGGWNMGSLLKGHQGDHAAGGTGEPGDRADLDFRFRGCRILVTDEPSGTSIDLDAVEGRGRRLGGLVVLDDLRGRADGGEFAIMAEMDGTRREPQVDLSLIAQGVELRAEMPLLTYLVPVLGGAGSLVEGRMDLDLELMARGRSPAEIAATLQGEGTVQVRPLKMPDTPLISELLRIAHLPGDGLVGTFSSPFTIRDRTIRSSEMTLTLGKVPIVLSGSTDFDGRVDYEIQAQAWLGRLSGEALQRLDELTQVVGVERPSLRVRGTVEHLDLLVDHLPITGENGMASDREKLQQLGRRMLDKLLR